MEMKSGEVYWVKEYSNFQKIVKKISDFQKTLFLIFKIEIFASSVIFFSSYIQLSIFERAIFDSPAWKQVYILLGLGILFDLSVVIYAFIAFFKKQRVLLIPLLGWFMYFMATAFYAKTLFLNEKLLDILMTSIYKVVEFLILSVFHFLCLYIARKLLKNTKIVEKLEL